VNTLIKQFVVNNVLNQLISLKIIIYASSYLHLVLGLDVLSTNRFINYTLWITKNIYEFLRATAVLAITRN